MRRILQDDKPPLFDAHDLLALSSPAMAGMVAELEFMPERMRAAAEAGHATATDLADWLVAKADVPFREAHRIVGRAVAAAEAAGKALGELSLDEIAGDRSRASTPKRSLACRSKRRCGRARSAGGTAPERVVEAIAAARAASPE